MKALSVRAPWWWFILHGDKDIENRDWSTRFRGTVYLHTSKWYRSGEVLEDMHAIATLIRPVPEMFELAHLRAGAGCIVGRVDIVDCVSHSSSPWFFGKYGFVLENPIAYARPVPCKGAFGFFDVPDEVVQELVV